MNRTNHIIFVGGIHGVGKTSICQQISKELNIKHLEASRIIAGERVAEAKSADKRVAAVSENQQDLISGLNKLTEPDKWYLLDGHIIIIDSETNLIQISANIFSQINPAGFIILVKNYQKIAERLKLRDGTEYDDKLLERMQNLEVEHARSISSQLARPLFIIEADHVHLFREAALKIMSKF